MNNADQIGQSVSGLKSQSRTIAARFQIVGMARIRGWGVPAAESCDCQDSCDIHPRRKDPG
jgi:hypothetical protein